MGMVIVEYIRKNRMGFLPGSRREVIEGVARDLVRWGDAKIEPESVPKPKRKRKRKQAEDADTSAEAINPVDPSDDDGGGGAAAETGSGEGTFAP